jgi:hypothetical protein
VERGQEKAALSQRDIDQVVMTRDLCEDPVKYAPGLRKAALTGTAIVGGGMLVAGGLTLFATTSLAAAMFVGGPVGVVGLAAIWGVSKLIKKWNQSQQYDVQKIIDHADDPAVPKGKVDLAVPYHDPLLNFLKQLKEEARTGKTGAKSSISESTKPASATPR